jgi:hypothetical protein
VDTLNGLQVGSYAVYIVYRNRDRGLDSFRQPVERLASELLRESGYIFIPQTDIQTLERLEIEVGEMEIFGRSDDISSVWS